MKTTGKITGIVSNLVTISVSGPVIQNEICYILYNGLRILSEVIRIDNERVYAQVFESTRGIQTGTEVEFTGKMLEVQLGPGMLAKVYDGLQSDLYAMESLFITRGMSSPALDYTKKWKFKPLCKVGDEVSAGEWLGEVQENWISHKIMVPFRFKEKLIIKSIVNEGSYNLEDIIAVVKNNEGQEFPLTMVFSWPVKRPVRVHKEKIRPFKILETGVRVIDIFNPMMEGGTGFIPGPFGCGKTVLQHTISKHADADLIIVVACGERANEVVELFTEFPNLDDPRTGRKMMERTIIICNTSNMPVAAREASVYTGMTIAEYYRAMGLKVLILADSTSRWAQALREMSNRMEELPGPDAYPMDLSAIVANFYARAGFTWLKNNKSGSVTFIGTVSPAGGNFKEPVTEATRKVARAFYALSQSRADSKRYPAIDPIESYSKYLEYDEVKQELNTIFDIQWTTKVSRLMNILIRGKDIKDQIGILGDDGVPVDYHEVFWKSEVIDFVLLQQDSFDKVDASTPLIRQKYMVDLLLSVCEKNYDFDHFEKVSEFFKKIINTLKQLNYSVYQEKDFISHEANLNLLISERTKNS
ncbi:MAG: V-type ATP synthase subunit A [Spirochaetia bacterium]|nr:V-type ATP synthase subunit A [Spirochaetia bacterium]